MECTVNDTLKHVLFQTRHFDRDDIEAAILAILIDLRVSTSHDGFEYLRIAILLNYHHPTGSLSSDVYPVITDYCETEVGAKPAEQAIRSAIVSAWKNRNDTVWSYYFAADTNGRIRKPTNAEFITKIARILELWHKCSTEVAYERE